MNTRDMRNSYLILLFCFATITANAQDLMDLLNDETEEDDSYVTSIFKASRVIHGHSVKTKQKGELEFLISHRFGTINSGWRELWGLDESNIRLGLEYGITDNLNVGIGRNSFQKTFDGFVKYKFLKQKNQGAPVSIVAFASTTVNSSVKEQVAPNIDPASDLDFSNRVTYTAQLLIARKINSNLTLQLMPSIVHKNLVTFLEDSNDQFALGVGGRYRITGSVTVNFEYYYQLDPNEFIGLEGRQEYMNSLALGVDIETGGHVFQIHLANSRSMIEKGFITETAGDFFDGDIHLGFNISRTFQLGNKR